MSSLRRTFGSLPVHIILIGLCALWILPTIGLLVTSFRPFQDVTSSGWWTVNAPPTGQASFQTNCSSCHGTDGKAIATADLTDPTLIQQFRRSTALLVLLKKPIGDAPHMGDLAVPDQQTAADIATYMRRISGIDAHPAFTINNYLDAMVGYRGTTNYETDCAAGTQSTDLHCDASDLQNPRGMAEAFVNTLMVAVPSTILPIIFAAFAAYAMSWMHFRGRFALFAVLVALQIVPLQMTLIPISKLYAQIGLNGTFLGIWLFHTGFGLPYAIYLTRNFLGGLPNELFEAAYMDGANHWTVFWRMALPLSVPALASLAIFQFLWIWNDLLVALVFLGAQHPVLTYQISTLVSSLGAGWHLLTAAAFISMLLPMIVFIAMQRYFVRGLLAGSVKG
ncbi:MAG: ABC transporter permease subunit [Chloroflexota bacterium]